MEATGERFLPDQMAGIIKAEHLNRYYFVTSQIDLSNKIILDIASGEGYGSNILAQKAKYVYGVDIAEEAIVHAKTKYKKDNLKYLLGSAFNIPIENNSIDIVVSFETIEHHDKHEEMMQEIKRVLKPEGILIISSPNKAEYSDKVNMHNHFHVKELYTKEFEQLLSKYFSNIQLFWQRYFYGSCILPVKGSYKCAIPIDVSNDNFEELHSVYDIAIASDLEHIDLPHLAVLYKFKEDTKLNDKYLSVLNSHAFKLGCFLLMPIYWIKKIANKCSH